MKVVIGLCLLLVTVAACIYIWQSGFGEFLETEMAKLSCMKIHNDCLKQSGVPDSNGIFHLSHDQQKAFSACVDKSLDFEGGVRCGYALGFGFLDTDHLL